MRVHGMEEAGAGSAFDALLTAPAPRAGDAEAEALARGLFGVAGRAARLSGERDLNFHIVPEAGPGWVLKIGNATEDRGVVALQGGALRHIAARDPELPVPRVCATRGGEDDAFATLESGTSHVVRLLTFLPGDPLHGSPPSDAQAAALGRCLARLGLALRGFAHPAARHDLLWDLQQAPRLHALLPHVADPRRRALAAGVLDRYEHHVAPRMAGFRRQVVHNDFNPHNIVVDPADPARVAGVLDFGDMVETPLVNDVAVAASYQVGADDPLGRVAALVGAYHAVSPLRREEVEVLPDLLSLRFVLSVVIAEWRAALHPENRAYILRNLSRAAAALDLFARIGPEAVRRPLARACTLE